MNLASEALGVGVPRQGTAEPLRRTATSASRDPPLRELQRLAASPWVSLALPPRAAFERPPAYRDSQPEQPALTTCPRPPRHYH